VDNAVRYTPGSGRVAVSVAAASGVVLTVTDTGPGVAAEELPRLGERFHRLGGQDTEGVGLGLSIVRRIAALHRARVAFAPAGERGLKATVEFPAVT
jgi:signal transduction histidine kinase